MTSWYSHVNIKHLQKVANQIRGEAIQLSHSTQTPRRDSLLSCIDMLVVLIGLYYQLSLKPVESKSQLGSYSLKCNNIILCDASITRFSPQSVSPNVDNLPG